MKRINKKDKVLLLLSAVILLVIAAFVIIFWADAYSLLKRMLAGVDLVEDYIQSLGLSGIVAMVIIMIACFFFPVISSAPIQVACGISYGLAGGSLIVLAAFFIAAQLLYLFRQNLRIFSSLKQIRKRLKLQKMIRESDRNIYVALMIAYALPAVPFLVICNLAASGLNYRKYTMVTTLGMIPDIIVTLFLGKKLLSSSPTASIITLFALLVIIVLSIVFNDKLVELAFVSKKKKGPEERS